MDEYPLVKVPAKETIHSDKKKVIFWLWSKFWRFSIEIPITDSVEGNIDVSRHVACKYYHGDTWRSKEFQTLGKGGLRTIRSNLDLDLVQLVLWRFEPAPIQAQIIDGPLKVFKVYCSSLFFLDIDTGRNWLGRVDWGSLDKDKPFIISSFGLDLARPTMLKWYRPEFFIFFLRKREAQVSIIQFDWVGMQLGRSLNNNKVQSFNSSWV